MTATADPFPQANALIFGGAKGIGKAIVMEWVQRGARVAIADIDEAAANETAAEIASIGGMAFGIHANVLSDESVLSAARSVEAKWGEIDIVMNNVGGMLNGHPEDIPLSEWQRIMDLNYFAAVRSIQHFLPGFLARGAGFIVNTASFAGLYPYAASRIPYAAAKAAVIAMTENLAIYAEPLGVRVSCLIPGPVATGVLESMTNWTQDCPMRGPGAQTQLMLPQRVAVKLADGMRDGHILIPSDDVAWDIVRRWADSPDDFIRSRIEEFARGETGRPMIDEDVRKILSGMQ